MSDPLEFHLLLDAEPTGIETSALAVGVYADGCLCGAAQAVDHASSGAVRRLLEQGFKALPGEVEVLRSPEGVAAARVILIGLGKRQNFDARRFAAVCDALAAYFSNTSLEEGVSTLAALNVDGLSFQERVSLVTLAMTKATYRYVDTLGTAEPPSVFPLCKLGLWATDQARQDAAAGIRQGAATGNGVNLTRSLGDLPPNVCTPSWLADTAQRLASEFPSLTAEILTRRDMEVLGMGALLSVARGSDEPPAFIILRHVPETSGHRQRPVVLVGKGVTFDSGGLSLKTPVGMEEMKYDMGGAACVFGVMRAVAELGLRSEVIALIPSCENMPSARALRPGDVVTSMSGQTIEVLNTDAEGRMILCDALTYAARFRPAILIDVATLTGACVTALGFVHSGLFSNDDDLAAALQKAGQSAGDSAWRMPLDDAYEDQIRSPFADMSNSGGRAAGAITAAAFLARFVGSYSWAHLDVAGTARKRGPDRQATGRPVPLLVRYLIGRSSEG